MLMQLSELRPLASSRNLLLRQLSRFDQSLLEPHVERVVVPRDTAVIERDQPLDAFYFPDTALVSVEETVRRHDHVEIALVGREGMLGWPALLGCESSSHGCVVQMRNGTLLKIGVDGLRQACASSPTLWASLLRFVQSVIVQMGRAITSHLEDPLDRRMARWLLMRHDRVGGDELLVRHEEMASSLGVRRASITDRLHVLEGERLVRCTRGRVLIRDRDGLEVFAGEAYGAAEAHYRATIAPFGKSSLKVPAVVFSQHG